MKTILETLLNEFKTTPNDFFLFLDIILDEANKKNQLNIDIHNKINSFKNEYQFEREYLIVALLSLIYDFITLREFYNIIRFDFDKE